MMAALVAKNNFMLMNTLKSSFLKSLAWKLTPTATASLQKSSGIQQQLAYLRTVSNRKSAAPQARVKPEQEVVHDTRDADEALTKDVITKVNSQIEGKSHGRLFAVLHVAGKQHKVTAEDLVIVQGDWAPQTGDQIRFEKVLLVGSRDFTLIGRPLLPKDLVRIEATIVEKTLSHTLNFFWYKKRKESQRLHRYRYAYTVVRINSIEFTDKVDQWKDVEGLKDRIL